MSVQLQRHARGRLCRRQPLASVADITYTHVYWNPLTGLRAEIHSMLCTTSLLYLQAGIELDTLRPLRTVDVAAAAVTALHDESYAGIYEIHEIQRIAEAYQPH